MKPYLPSTPDYHRPWWLLILALLIALDYLVL